MAARTKRIYRDASLFEQIALGTTAFDTLAKRDLSRVASFVTALFLTLIAAIVAVLAGKNGNAPLGWGLAATTAVLGLYVVKRFLSGLYAAWARWFRRPSTVYLDEDGVFQQDGEGQTIQLAWEDIRMVRHKRSAHLIRGRDKKQQIFISTRLLDHEDLSAFIKFSFLLRQEAGANWAGLLNEVRARLEGPGFHFHYDSNRKNTVHISTAGLLHTAPDGSVQEMSWEQMKASVFEPTRSMLKFRHTGSKTSLAIPRGTDSDQVIEHFIRWALHTAPEFSDRSA